MTSTAVPHHRVIAVAVLFAVLNACAATGHDLPGNLSALTPGDHSIGLQHDGRARRYHIHVPPHPSGQALPVMLALHGGGGSGLQFQRENGLDRVADRDGFLAVYPDGTGILRDRLLTWNAGTHCCGRAREQDVDDTGFLIAVLDDLATRTPVDPARIYATGHSNGAMMAYRLAAGQAGRLAAIIPVGGALDLDTIAPDAPVAVLHIHSVDDPRALYTGGPGPPFPGTDRRVDHRPVRHGLDLWAQANGCDPGPVTASTVTGTGPDEGQRMSRLVYRGCRPGGAVEHLRLEGSGHGWPGVTAPRWRQRLLGPPTGLIHASEEAWRFAARFARRDTVTGTR